MNFLSKKFLLKEREGVSKKISFLSLGAVSGEMDQRRAKNMTRATQLGNLALLSKEPLIW